MANRILTMRTAFHMLCVIAFFIAHAVAVYAADIPNVPALKEAIKKYYDTVDNAKRPYENELRKVLSNTQKAGNLKAYNAIEAELDHTVGKHGHCYTAFAPPRGSAMLYKKTALKRAVDNARQEFKETVARLASEQLKNGFVDRAREIDETCKELEPPRLSDKNKVAENKQEALPVKDIRREALLRRLQEDYGSVPPHLTLEEIERFRTARKKGYCIPDATLKIQLSSRQGSWCEIGQWTPDGKKFIAVSLAEKGANVFDIATGKPVMKLPYPHNICSIGVHPDGQIVATGTLNGYMLLWNIDNGRILRETKAHEASVDGVRFSSDGLRIISGSRDKTIAIWDTKTGKERMRIPAPAPILRMAVSPDDKLLATSLEDGTVRLWDVGTGKELHCLKGHSHKNIYGLAFNHQGTILASGAFDHTVVFWDAKTGKQIKRLIGCESGVASVGFSPDDSQVVVGCADSICSAVWDFEKGVPLYRVAFPIENGRGWDQTVQFSPDGKLIAASSHDPISVVNVFTNDELALWEKRLKAKRNTAKEISLKEMPMEHASKLGWGIWCWNTMSIQGVAFDNSLWAHAPSTYVFPLNRSWKKFKTTFGLTAIAPSKGGNCIFIVKGDGRELFRSDVIKDSRIRSVEVNVQNVDKLELIVDPNGSRGWDQAIWFAPTLSR